MTVLRTKQGALTERVARLLLGAPQMVDRDKGSARFGDISVNLVTGRFYDLEEESGGDHLELIRRFKRVQNGQAEQWLADNVINVKPELARELEAERMLLGLLSSVPSLVDSVEEEVTIDHFADPIHKQMFTAIVEASRVSPEKPVPMGVLIDACGGDPLMPVDGVAEGLSVSQYIARMTIDTPMVPDGPHFARTLAAKIRSDANREGEIADDYDLDPDPEPFISQFGGIPFEALDDPGPEHEHVIDGLITVGDKSVIAGPSRSGKSFLAIHMAMCIATRTPFFGRKILTDGLVIYQAGEGGRGIKKRFRAWRQYYGLKPDTKVPVYILQSRVDIYSHEGDTAKLITEVQGISRMYGMPVVAIFIDTLAKASGTADENSGRDMGTVMANVDRLADSVPGCHVCLVHHMNAGGTKMRGHTSVDAGVDQVVLVTKVEDSKVRTATLDKQKDEEDGAKIDFELASITIGHRPIDGNPITSCVPVPAGEVVSTNAKGAALDKSKRLTDDQANIFSALKDAVAEFGVPTPPQLKLPRAISRVCKVNDWFNVYRAVASKEDAAMRQAMARASDKLVRLRLIGRINPYVWLTNAGVAQVTALPANPTPGALTSGEPVQEEFPEE